ELRRERLSVADGTGSLLVCRGVEVAYDQVQVLFGVDMDVKPGECVALLGTNGAGKSTLLKAISGVVEPMGGAIFFDGRDVTHSDGVATTKAGVIQVPGGKAVFPTLTVAEHLRAGGWLYRDDPKYLEGAAKTSGTTAPAQAAAHDREMELADKPVVLDVRSIVKSFGGIRAVDDASFHLRDGEILGLIGPNGAGKTTIFDLISGFLT